MPTYLFEAKDSHGARVAETLDRPSIAVAIEELEARGWTAIQVVGDSSPTGPVLVKPGTPAVDLSARQLVELWKPASRSTRSFQLIRNRARTGLAFSVGAIVWFGLRRYGRGEWTWFDAVLVIGAVSPVLEAAYLMLWSDATIYRRYLIAVVDARWEDALAEVERLGKTIEPLNLGMMKARCLAGLGRRGEAFALVDALKPDDPTSLFPYWSQAANVFGGAHDYERQLEATRTALSLAPDRGPTLLSLSQLLATRFDDPASARIHLDEARGSPLPAWASYIWSFLEGIILVEEGHAAESVAHLNDAHRQLESSVPGAPLMQGALEIVEVYQAIAAASLGDRLLAETIARKVRPRWEARGDARLLAKLTSLGL